MEEEGEVEEEEDPEEGEDMLKEEDRIYQMKFVLHQSTTWKAMDYRWESSAKSQQIHSGLSNSDILSRKHPEKWGGGTCLLSTVNQSLAASTTTALFGTHSCDILQFTAAIT